MSDTQSNEFAQAGQEFLAEAEAEAAESAGAEVSGQTASASSDVDAQAKELAAEALKGKKPQSKAPPQKNGATAGQQPDPNTWKPKALKVNGREYTPKTLAELEAAAMRGYAFMQRAEDINRLHSETSEASRRMKEDLAGYLTDLHRTDPERAADVAEKLLLERAQLRLLEQENPAAAQAYRLQKELERRDAADKQRQEQAEGEQLQRLQAEQEEQLDRLLEQTLVEANLPKTTPTVRTMAHMYRLALSKGIELTPVELAAQTRDVLNTTFGQYLDAFDDEDMLESLGPQRLERIRKALLARAQRPARQAQSKPAAKKPAAKSWQDEDAADKDDFENYIGRLKRQAAKEMFKR
jgi:hypothetical protein